MRRVGRCELDVVVGWSDGGLVQGGFKRTNERNPGDQNFSEREKEEGGGLAVTAL